MWNMKIKGLLAILIVVFVAILIYSNTISQKSTLSPQPTAIHQNKTPSASVGTLNKSNNQTTYIKNITINKNDSLFVSVVSNRSSDISLLTPTEFTNFEQNHPYTALFGAGSNSSRIFIINQNLSGRYFLLINSASRNLEFNSLVVAKSSYKIINGSENQNLNIGNYSLVNFTMASLTPMNISLYYDGDNSSISLFKTSKNQLSEWATHALYMNRGNYTIRTNAGTKNYLLLLNITPRLVNPFFNIYTFGYVDSLPIGIASYGISDNFSSRNLTYQINTNEIVGIANITYLDAYNQYASSTLFQHGAGLQMNVMLNSNSGSRRTYWLQDVIQFNTNNDTLNFLDNIWNMTAYPYYIEPTTLYGNGYVSSKKGETPLGIPDTIYYYKLNNSIHYVFPFYVTLIRTHSVGNNQIVNFGYQIKNFTTGKLSLPVFYDNVTIHGISGSSILITPYYYTPGNLTSLFRPYYDAELVFGGIGSGASIAYPDVNATLSLYYNNSGLKPFPSVFPFGRDTEESTTDVLSAVNKNTGYITNGNLNPLYSLITTQTTNNLSNLEYFQYFPT